MVKTRKIVINTCHGGFSLSDEACERLIELGVPLRKMTAARCKKRCIYENETDIKLLGKYHDVWFYQHRNDELLIKVVEELGVERAGGKYAQLKIVKIPSDVKWDIEEYDGVEWVSEDHRTWQ